MIIANYQPINLSYTHMHAYVNQIKASMWSTRVEELDRNHVVKLKIAYKVLFFST